MGIVEPMEFASSGSVAESKYALEVNGVRIKFRPTVHPGIEDRATSGVLLGWSFPFGPPFAFVIISE